MCAIFGLLDYRNNFSGPQKDKLLHILSSECEARGTDATGIAYNTSRGLQVYKRPLAAHRLHRQWRAAAAPRRYYRVCPAPKG